MVKIIISNNDKSYEINANVDIDVIHKLIKETMVIYDKNILINMITGKLKEYLVYTFYVSIKELSNYFESQAATINFIEAMKFHGYFIKYHTTYKCTEELHELLAKYLDGHKNVFDMDEGLLFNEVLGFDAIRYMLSAKSFQKVNILNITELTKKKATKIFDFMICEEFLTRNGTTYTITNKFIQRAKQYKELFEEVE